LDQWLRSVIWRAAENKVMSDFPDLDVMTSSQQIEIEIGRKDLLSSLMAGDKYLAISRFFLLLFFYKLIYILMVLHVSQF
jgi:hypothetical protein